MSRLYVVADTHFNHENIIKYTGRPFKTAEEMNEVMVVNWNHLVTPSDATWVLGDFGIEKTISPPLKRLLTRLNGKKMLVRGNHDYETISKYYEMGFSAVVDSATLEYGNARVMMIHIPLTYAIPQGIDYIFHGHIHQNTADNVANVKSPERHLNVCVEQTAYKPMLFDKALAKARRQCQKK